MLTPAEHGSGFLHSGSAGEGEEFLPRDCVPHIHALFPTPGGEGLPVGAEAQTSDLIFVSLEGENLAARECVPHLDRMVLARRSKACAVRAEAYTPHSVDVPEGEDLSAGVRVPHLHRPV